MDEAVKRYFARLRATSAPATVRAKVQRVTCGAIVWEGFNAVTVRETRLTIEGFASFFKSWSWMTGDGEKWQRYEAFEALLKTPQQDWKE